MYLLFSVLSRLSCSDVLYSLSCSECPVPAVLSQLSCPTCPVPIAAILSRQSCPSVLSSAVRFLLSCSVLSSLSCRSSPATAILSSCPVLAVLSRLLVPNVLYRPFCPSCPVSNYTLHPGMFWLSCPTVCRLLPLLSFSGSPVKILMLLNPQSSASCERRRLAPRLPMQH